MARACTRQGPRPLQADLDAAFPQADGALLAIALGGVLLTLLLVHRSVIMPLLVITSFLLVLAVACAVLYALARANWLSIDGQTQGIVFVLVVGASTDDVLLPAVRASGELAERPDACRVRQRRQGISLFRGLDQSAGRGLPNAVCEQLP
ncbi:MMPL family transporter [Streptomyces roseolus]|uniref:MMPL family transporter n=1 Tax=Streptomyces roseolus TaxID=67358 RepID=UPI00362E8DB9